MKQKGRLGRRLTALGLSASMILGSSAAAFAEGEIGNGVYSTYDEAYYVSLDYYGNLTDASMVKSYILNGVDTVTDYGDYKSINNLTDGTDPASENGAHVFRFGDDAPSHFYFEGKTDKPFEALPWTISVSYKLNGVPTKAEDLAGKTGVVEINVDAIPVDTASEYARNNYTLEVMGLFNQDDILSLNAPGAQVQLIGNLRAVLFLGLPGEEEHFTIQVGTEDFAFGGLTMLMVPANLGALDQISGLSDKKDDLEDNYRKLDRSIDTLLDSFSGMSASLRETANGLDELNEARGIISDEKGGLYEQADTALEDVDELRGDLQTASDSLEDMKKTVDDVTEDLQAMNDVLDKTSTSLDRLEKALEDLDKDFSLLQSYSRGSGNDIRTSLRDISSDTAALGDALEDFTATLALLDLQIGGKDITIQGVPTQELDEQSKKLEQILDLYDATSAIAPINNADMFMVAANAMANGISPKESAAQIQAQKQELTDGVTAVIMAVAQATGMVMDEAQAMEYIAANAASDPDLARLAAGLQAAQQQSELMQTLYAQTATGRSGLMTEEDFMTALLMAQDIQSGKPASAVVANKAAYRDSAAKSFALMDALENGMMANLAALCDSLSKGTKAASDLIGGSNSNLSKRLKDVTDDLDTLATRTENLLKQVCDMLNVLGSIGKDAEEAAPDLKDDLEDARTLLSHLDKTAEDTTGLLRNVESVMQDAGVKLDDGTKRTLEGLAVTLRKLADSTDATGGVRSAKNSVSDIVEDVWEDYTGKLNNLLLMDPSAPAQSLTDSRNPAPVSIQILLRTQEIKKQSGSAPDSGPAQPEDTSDAHVSFFHRIADMFRGIWQDIAQLLHKDAEGKEAAEL